MHLAKKTDVANALNDTLFTVAGTLGHAGMLGLCRLRATCGLWRQTIDSATSNSAEWQAMACAMLGASTHEAYSIQTGPTSHSWRDACYVLHYEPSRMVCLNSGLAVRRLLDWFVLAAELTAVDFQCPFSTILDGEGRSQASLAIYNACSQKPPHNLQAFIYSWWLHYAFKIVITTRSRMAGENEAVQQRARASFRSFVKIMSSVVLPYLDRSFVRRFEVGLDASLSLPSVRQIGGKAVELIEFPFGMPLPAGALDLFSQVPLAAPSSDVDFLIVDEVAMAQRQRLTWERNLNRFDQVLMGNVLDLYPSGSEPHAFGYTDEN